MPRMKKVTAKKPQAQITSTMPVTTAEVVASPTAEALRPLWRPRRHPATAMRIPYTDALNTPPATSPRSTALIVWLK
jgi:hypothetical protein